jgi:hypothetical protein
MAWERTEIRRANLRRDRADETVRLNLLTEDNDAALIFRFAPSFPQRFLDPAEGFGELACLFAQAFDALMEVAPVARRRTW